MYNSYMLCALMYNFINTALSFWKAPNRKIYAVTQANLNTLDEGASDGSDDEELTVSTAKRLKKEVQEGMKKIKEELATLRSMMPRALPDNLMDHLTGLMRCCICQVVPIRPPVVISKCCRSIIGCEQYVQQLVDNQEASSCPLCRAVEFDINKVNGFDGLLSAMGNHITEDGN